ncbi:hypothetical protein QEZ54_27565 [Catellatospora sp. KI3]|uniref:hypothetical protein n=1 Tax=Catellatospora sp. KI3 TaxID=3041620 RepID=UPI002482FEC1|nr:hypothetical protein [Catellatospora sp. KI3]MDI1464734.1 hypothetical protein [Catellatospora sp. KI3]
MSPAEHAEVSQWLARHGMADAEPTPLLAARLAVRGRAKFMDSLLLAVFLMGAALTHALALPGDVTSARWPLLVLVALVAALLAGQWLVGRWVRRADQRAGAGLPQRVAHPVELGWPAVLGRPFAVFTVAAYASAGLLALSVLPVADPGLRRGAAVVLIGLAGACAGLLLQLRQVLASPAVAQDEASLTADVIMRVEDARALVTPSLVWSLPPIFLYGESLGWWNAAAVALVVAGVAAFALIQFRAPRPASAARQAMATR